MAHTGEDQVVFPLDLRGFRHITEKVPSEIFITLEQDFYFVFLPEKLQFARLRATTENVTHLMSRIFGTRLTLMVCNLKEQAPKDYVSWGECHPTDEIPRELYEIYKESILKWLSSQKLRFDATTGYVGDRDKSIRIYHYFQHKQYRFTAWVGLTIIKVDEITIKEQRKRLTNKFGNELEGFEVSVSPTYDTPKGISSIGRINILVTGEQLETIRKSYSYPEQYFYSVICAINLTDAGPEEGLNFVLDLQKYSFLNWRSVLYYGAESLNESQAMKTFFMRKEIFEEKVEGDKFSFQEMGKLDSMHSKIMTISRNEEYVSLSFLSPSLVTALIFAKRSPEVQNLFHQHNMAEHITDFMQAISNASSFSEDGSLLDHETLRSIRKIKEILHSIDY